MSLRSTHHVCASCQQCESSSIGSSIESISKRSYNSSSADPNQGRQGRGCSRERPQPRKILRLSGITDKDTLSKLIKMSGLWACRALDSAVLASPTILALVFPVGMHQLLREKKVVIRSLSANCENLLCAMSFPKLLVPTRSQLSSVIPALILQALHAAC